MAKARKCKDPKNLTMADRAKVSDEGVLSTEAGYILARKSSLRQIIAARKIVDRHRDKSKS